MLVKTDPIFLLDFLKLLRKWLKKMKKLDQYLNFWRSYGHFMKFYFCCLTHWLPPDAHMRHVFFSNFDISCYSTAKDISKLLFFRQPPYFFSSKNLSYFFNRIISISFQFSSKFKVFYLKNTKILVFLPILSNLY